MNFNKTYYIQFPINKPKTNINTNILYYIILYILNIY